MCYALHVLRDTPFPSIPISARQLSVALIFLHGSKRRPSLCRERDFKAALATFKKTEHAALSIVSAHGGSQRSSDPSPEVSPESFKLTVSLQWPGIGDRPSLIPWLTPDGSKLSSALPIFACEDDRPFQSAAITPHTTSQVRRGTSYGAIRIWPVMSATCSTHPFIAQSPARCSTNHPPSLRGRYSQQFWAARFVRAGLHLLLRLPSVDLLIHLVAAERAIRLGGVQAEQVVPCSDVGNSAALLAARR